MPSIFVELLTPSLRRMSTVGEYPLKAGYLSDGRFVARTQVLLGIKSEAEDQTVAY